MAYEGIRIIDFTQYEQGTAATQVLADFGAEVIKIERIDVGDPNRTLAPFLNGVALWFAALNRNKRSLSLNLKTPEAKEIIYRLVKVSDVVASNFRVGVMERLGFGYEKLSRINPRIICAYASGYGRTGPYWDKRGQDLLGQAMGGLMALTGTADGQPTASGTYLADFLGAMLLAQGIMIALAARERTGQGQEVDTCLLNASVVAHLQESTAFLNVGETYPRPLPNLCHARIDPLYGTYQTRDGKWLVVVGQFVGGEWKRVCRALGLPDDVGDDPRFQTHEGLAEHEEEILPILRQAFARWTREEALKRLEVEDILAGPVYDDGEVFADPQVLHNEMVLEIEHPAAGNLKLVGVPVKLSKTPGTLRMPPPTVGQHNEEILNWLGYSQSELQELQEKGVVGSEEKSMFQWEAEQGCR